MGARFPLPKQARRDSNPQPPVLETGALPIELRTSLCRAVAAAVRAPNGQGRNRTTDTAIFSRVLYQLSYLADKKTARAFSAGGRSDEERSLEVSSGSPRPPAVAG